MKNLFSLLFLLLFLSSYYPVEGISQTLSSPSSVPKNLTQPSSPVNPDSAIPGKSLKPPADPVHVDDMGNLLRKKTDDKKADLIPVSEKKDNKYCNVTKRKPRKLKVYVRNRGIRKATTSTTKISFYTSSGTESAYFLETPPIGTKETTMVGTLAIPKSCLKATCKFTITVDSKDEVDELTNSNNSVNGFCSASDLLK